MNAIRNAWVFAVVISCCLGPSSSATVAQIYESHARLLLGTEANRTASLRIGDLDADGDLDVVVANGRHWPQQNYTFLNQGRARFNVMRPLGIDRSTTYACELADLDGDGDLDVVTGNDMAPCQIFLNNGKASFRFHRTFGEISSVRSLTLTDIDQDGDPDILITCRGRSNQICLNDGAANFPETLTFGTQTDSTIDVEVGDVDGDGDNDLVLANRDGQQSSWLLNDGRLNFLQVKNFGDPKGQSRAVTIGDFDGDQDLDWAVGNVGQANRLFIGDGQGGVEAEVPFGDPASRTYCLASFDMDRDGDLDLVAGNSGQPNVVYLNEGEGKSFREVVFDDAVNLTYGLSIGDLNSDGTPDVAVANSDSTNQVVLGRLAKTSATTSNILEESETSSADQLKAFQGRVEYQGRDWPAFRGLGGRGVAEGFPLPVTWNADPGQGDLENVLWQIEVPGLGHSSPVVAGDKLFLLTAVAKDGKAPLEVAAGGKPTAAEDNESQDWLLLCYDKSKGHKLWSRTLRQGKPRATRHTKATHANTSVCVVGNHLVTFLGSEGLYCHDLSGNELWKQDLGVINISKYGIGWGFSSSPAVHGDRIVLVCDDPENPFVTARRLSDGEEIWRTSRKEVCERSWGTPLIHTQGREQVVVNGWPWMVSYQLSDGKEIWRIQGGGDNPIPSPFEAHGLIYITNAHGGPSPIHAVHPEAEGQLEPNSQDSAMAWSVDKGGSYMSTPVVYGEQIYLGNSNGIVRSFHAKSGAKVFEQRLGDRAGVIASLVAGDGKIYCASENGKVYVLAHGPEMRVLAENSMDGPCFATPAISEGLLFIRTTERLTAILGTPAK